MATLRSLLDYVEQFTPEIRKAFLSAIQDIKDNAVIARIVEKLELGDITGAVQALGIDPAAMRPLTAAIESAFETGGVFMASQFPRTFTGAVFRFDVRNSRAEAWLRDNSSTLVTRITEEQLSLVRNTMLDGMTNGINPRSIALDLVGRYDPVTQQRTGGIVGLNQQQKTYLSNARKDLETLDSRYLTRELRDKRFDGIVQKAIDSGTPLPADQIDKLLTRYSDKMLLNRGETIARTEAIASLNQAQLESVKQMVETGSIDNQDVKREWDSTGRDGRTRDSHLAMDRQRVGPDEPFTTPDGEKLMFPGDTSLGASGDETINCRCRQKLVIDWLRKAREG